MANSLKTKNQPLIISMDTSELSPKQCRLIKSLNAYLANVLSTDNESEFFDGSAEVMRLCASVIKCSSFVEDKKTTIPYAEQALEYSLEILHENIESKKIVQFDN